MNIPVGLIPIKEDQKFSLKSLSVDCSIRNLLVSCTSEFVYKNDENQDIEALFSFPLDNNCVVYYLEAVIGNKTIMGVCKEVEEAKNLYKAAKEMGHMTAMIERNTSMSDVFKCRIGNFPKQSEAKIVLKFALELKLSLARSEVKGVDRLNLALPLILRPRYTPSGYERDLEVYQVTNKYEYHFKATINGTKAISDITAVNHTLCVNYTNDNKTCAQVTLQSEHDDTKDLDINIDYLDMREPSVFYELGTRSNRYTGKKVAGAFYQPDVAMVNFLPKFSKEDNQNQLKTEIVFIVDRSGSMVGSNIERARECLLIFLKSLPVNCKFQIYGFGSRFDKAFNDSQLYTDQSINIALTYQKNLRADFGGTELKQPLEDMYRQPLTPDHMRVAFVLTDGAVGNQDEVTSLVRKHNKTTRLFTVGIGDGVSTSLVDQMAKAGLGRSAFVRNAKELSASVIELLDLAINCLPFTDAKIDWKCPEHVSIISVPSSTPPIFSNYFLTTFCMINGLKEKDVIHCTLSGKVNDQPVSFAIEIGDSKAEVDEEFRVHRLLAKYKIDEMTVEINDGKEDLKKPLIDLSTEINIVTNWTTFVAIDQDAPDVVMITEDPEPNSLHFRRLRCGGARSANYAPPGMAGHSMEKSDRCQKMAVKKKMALCGLVRHKVKDDATPSPRNLSAKCKSSSFRGDANMGMNDATEEVKESDDVIMFLAGKQNINGSWNFDEAIFKKIGVEIEKVKEKRPEQTSEQVWATIVVYQFLVVKEGSREKEWRLFGKKARQWIESNLTDPQLLSAAFTASLELF